MGLWPLVLRLGVLMAPLACAGNGAVQAPALLAPLPTDADSVARLRQVAGEGARRFETEHFSLVHTASAHSVCKLGARLEAVYRAHVRLARELRIPVRRPTHKLEVLLFGTYEEFRAHQRRIGSAGEEILGFYEPVANRAVFFDLATYPPVADLYELRPNLRDREWIRRRELSRRLRHNTQALNGQVIQHEAAHQIQVNLGFLPAAGAPSWLAEGLAQLFELPFTEEGATLALSINRYRLYEFGELHACDTEALGELRRMVGAESAWRGGEDYPWAWALTSHLYIRQRGRFAEYVRSVAQETGSPASEPAARLDAFERCFGPLDESFVDGFCGYLERLRQRCPPGPLWRPD